MQPLVPRIGSRKLALLPHGHLVCRFSRVSSRGVIICLLHILLTNDRVRLCVVCSIGRHADEVLSETEQRFQKIKNLPPEARPAAEEGFKVPHAERDAQGAAKAAGKGPQAQQEGQVPDKERAQGPQASREAAQRAEE